MIMAVHVTIIQTIAFMIMAVYVTTIQTIAFMIMANYSPWYDLRGWLGVKQQLSTKQWPIMEQPYRPLPSWLYPCM